MNALLPLKSTLRKGQSGQFHGCFYHNSKISVYCLNKYLCSSPIRFQCRVKIIHVWYICIYRHSKNSNYAYIYVYI